MATPRKDPKKKKPAGQKPFKITPAILKKAEALAATGINQRQIAANLGMGESTFYEKLVSVPELADRIATGRQKGITLVVNAVFNKAKAGDIQAAKYFLNNKDKADWKEKIENTHVGADGGAIETVTEIKRTVID